MGPQGIAVMVGIGVTLVGSLLYFLYPTKGRYMTHNSNAVRDNFSVYRSECPICLENIRISNEAILNCGHTLCRDCLSGLEDRRAYFTASVCPVCRTPIRVD